MGIIEFLGRTGILSVMGPGKKFGEKNIIFYSYPGTEKPPGGKATEEHVPKGYQPSESHIPTSKEVEEYPTGVKGMKEYIGKIGKGLKKLIPSGKRDKQKEVKPEPEKYEPVPAKEPEISGVSKEYVDRALEGLRSRVEKPSEEAIIYRGSIGNRNAVIDVGKIGAEIDDLFGAYRVDIGAIEFVDKDLPKVDLSRYSTENAATGKEFDQMQYDAKENVPRIGEDYARILRDMENVETSAKGLTELLNKTDKVLETDRARYEMARQGYEKAKITAQKQRDNVVGISETNGNFLRSTLEKEIKRMTELEENYRSVVSSIDETKNRINGYKESAGKLIDYIGCAKGEVGKRIAYTTGVTSEMPSPLPEELK